MEEMNPAVIAADQDPNHPAAGHGWPAALFMTIAVLGGCYLVGKALRLVRHRHDPHAARYSHPRH